MTNPDVIKLRAALIEIRDALQVANASVCSPINDTIWMVDRPETLFDFIDSTIAATASVTEQAGPVVRGVDITKARVKEGCDCGCNVPVATDPIEMLKFLAGRFEFAGVNEAVAKTYAHDIRKILAAHPSPALPAAMTEEPDGFVRVPIDRITVGDCYRFGLDINAIRSASPSQAAAMPPAVQSGEIKPWKERIDEKLPTCSQCIRAAEAEIADLRAALAASPSAAPALTDAELPGLWSNSDLSGGATDCVPTSGGELPTPPEPAGYLRHDDATGTQVGPDEPIFNSDQMREYAISARATVPALDYETERAIMEAERNAAVREYFKARPQLEGLHNERIFESGFQCGFERVLRSALLSRYIAPTAPEGWKLDFRPSSETPTEPGDYILYNQCDGYHIVEAWFDEGEFADFWVFAASSPVSKDFYCAWAKLPDTLKDLYPRFSRDAQQATGDAKP